MFPLTLLPLGRRLQGRDGPPPALPRGTRAGSCHPVSPLVPALTLRQASWAKAASRAAHGSRTHVSGELWKTHVCTETRTGEGPVSTWPGRPSERPHAWAPDLTPGPGTDRTRPGLHRDSRRLSICPSGPALRGVNIHGRAATQTGVIRQNSPLCARYGYSPCFPLTRRDIEMEAYL